MLKLGINISIELFWEMTPDEMYVLTSARGEYILEEHKNKLTNIYNLSTMIALFVNLGLNGKSIPSIGKIFPGLYSLEEIEQAEVERYKSQFMAFMQNRNAVFEAKKGLTNDT